MNLSFTRKMILDEEVKDKEILTVFIRSYLKPNLTERMIKIKFLNFIPAQILFSSYKYRNAHWTSDLGIIEANS
ncbi:hypothetical protein [Leptospira meyeri]|nr:hypothetical protein [Leptospira meyeri]